MIVMSQIQTLVETSHWSVFILVAGFISSGLAVLYFKSILAFLIEIILLVALVGLSSSLSAVVIISVIQIVYSLLLAYCLMETIHYNYMLILEKTNNVPTDLTQKGRGIRSSFLLQKKE